VVVIVDVVAALTDSVQPDGYIKDMRRRDPELSKGWGQFVTPPSVKTSGGDQKLNCANTERIFRVIQSIRHESRRLMNGKFRFLQ
jgi:DNA-damage-inducible protein D